MRLAVRLCWRDNTPACLGEVLWQPNIVSMDIRTAIARRSRAKSPEKNRPRRLPSPQGTTTAWGQDRLTCPEPAPSRAARRGALVLGPFPRGGFFPRGGLGFLPAKRCSF